MRKIIVLPDATDDIMYDFALKLSKLREDETILVQHDIKIYDIDNVKIWSKHKIKKFLEENGFKLKEK